MDIIQKNDINKLKEIFLQDSVNISANNPTINHGSCGSHGVIPNCRKRHSLLELAAEFGSKECFEFLSNLPNQKDIQICNPQVNQWGSLELAIASGDINLVKSIIEKNQGIVNERAICVACFMHNEDILNLLLANISTNGSTETQLANALNICIETNYFYGLVLLETIQSSQKISIDKLCTVCYDKNYSMFKSLIRSLIRIEPANNKPSNDFQLVDFSFQNHFYNTARILFKHYKMSGSKITFELACKGNNLDLLKFQIISGYIDDGSLYYACEGNSTEIFDFLISQGANVNYRCEVSRFGDNCNYKTIYSSPLEKATKTSKNLFIKKLLEAGADPNLPLIDGGYGYLSQKQYNFFASPLIIACKNQNIEAVNILISKKADINFGSEIFS